VDGASPFRDRDPLMVRKPLIPPKISVSLRPVSGLNKFLFTVS